jgi:4-amino-4-deoxy-L-arabinose transferase-like glycosyltransferase
MTWAPTPGRYISDPYTYLQYAREMRSFYAAHRREPVFPFVTKIFLRLLDQQDVAVSFASASFSVAAIAATFLLGAYASSYWVGIGAAIAMAVEYDVITWGAGGWRDDAFTFAVVLFAYATLRFARDPSGRHAVAMGAVAGLACLVRITALSFVLPGFACLALIGARPVRARLAGIATGLLVATVIAAPFLVNCWRVFGDPFYAINVHANVYRSAEGQPEQQGLTAAAYLSSAARSRPFETLDTALMGLTAYPFQNKWRGFEPWAPDLGWWLSRASWLGLFLFLGSPAGRLLLVVLGTSLVPYAMTWKLISDWRFTAHAYPIFLVAACLAIRHVVLCAAPPDPLSPRRWPPLRRVAWWAAALAGVGLGAWAASRVMPVLTARESLLAGEAMTITSGSRDGSFFTTGWSQPLREGNVTARVSGGSIAAVNLPLPRSRDHSMTLRLDPFPRPLEEAPAGLPTVRVFLNGHPVARLDLRWNPERVGAYDVRLPGHAVKEGINRLELLAEPATAAGLPSAAVPDVPRFRLWYVRIRP